MSTDAHEAMVRDVVALVQGFASRFDRATMDGPTPEPPAGMRVEMSCAAPGTARVVMYPSDDEINVHIGQDTWIELMKGKRGRAERLQQLREILEAVVHGRYEETIWRFHGTIIKSRAVLSGPDGRALMKPRGWHGLGSLLADPRAERSQTSYERFS